MFLSSNPPTSPLAACQAMATLGYRDSGSVVLSKAEALRQAHEKVRILGAPKWDDGNRGDMKSFVRSVFLPLFLLKPNMYDHMIRYYIRILRQQPLCTKTNKTFTVIQFCHWANKCFSSIQGTRSIQVR